MLSPGLYEVDVGMIEEILREKEITLPDGLRVVGAYVYITEEFVDLLYDEDTEVDEITKEFLLDWETVCDTAYYDRVVAAPDELPDFIEKYKEESNMYIVLYLSDGRQIITACGEGGSILNLPEDGMIYGWMDECFPIVFEEYY